MSEHQICTSLSGSITRLPLLMRQNEPLLRYVITTTSCLPLLSSAAEEHTACARAPSLLPAQPTGTILLNNRPNAPLLPQESRSPPSLPPPAAQGRLQVGDSPGGHVPAAPSSAYASSCPTQPLVPHEGRQELSDNPPCPAPPALHFPAALGATGAMAAAGAAGTAVSGANPNGCP